MDRIAEIIAALNRFRLSVGTEADLQASIRFALGACGIGFICEFPLSRGPVDFMIPDGRIAIEAKTQGSPASVTKQLLDYLDDAAVAGLILVTSKRRLGRLPTTALGKPLAVVALWRSML